MKCHLIFICLIFTQVLSAQVPDSLKYISLSPAEFNKARLNDTNSLLVDVREFFEYRKSRIKNAVNIPSSENIQVSADTIDKGKHLFVYCTSGYRARRVAIKLYDSGFTHLYNLEGGIMAWRKAEMPLDKKKLKKKDKQKGEEGEMEKKNINK
jgi:rhodanese-related sulfurtransferase